MSTKKELKAKELKLKRIRIKAERNSNKKSVTTKSFNDKKNKFIPRVEQVRNPDSVLYLQLKNKGLLPKKRGKVITYKKWQDNKLMEAIKRV